MWNNNNNYSPFLRMYNPQNSYNPLTYQPLPSSINSNTNYSQSNMQNMRSQNNLIWVTGKENARTMQLQPNSSLIMLDNEANKFYIKTTDDIGLGKIRVFSYVEEDDVDNQQTDKQLSSIDLSNYVTKDQLQTMLLKLKEGKPNEQSISTAKTADEF